MGKHIIADGLRLPQTSAMADHEPAMGPHDRKVVGDVLGVRGADADIDKRHAVAIAMKKMIGRHLKAVPRRRADEFGDRLVARPRSIMTPLGRINLIYGLFSSASSEIAHRTNWST